MASIISLVNKKEDFNTMEQFFLKDNSKTTTTTNSEINKQVQKAFNLNSTNLTLNETVSIAKQTGLTETKDSNNTNEICEKIKKENKCSTPHAKDSYMRKYINHKCCKSCGVWSACIDPNITTSNPETTQGLNDPNPSTTYSSGNKVNSTQNPGTTTLSSNNPGTTTLSSNNPGTTTLSSNNPGTTTLSSNNPSTTTLSSNNPGTTSPINDNKVSNNCGDIGDALYSFKDYDAEHKNPQTDFTIHMNDSGKITYKYDDECTSFDSDSNNQCSNNTEENNEENNEENESIDEDIYINETKELTDEQINKVSNQILNNNNDNNDNNNNNDNDLIDKAIQFVKYLGIILLVLFICLSLYLFLG